MRKLALAACFVGMSAQAQTVPDSAGLVAVLSTGMRLLAPAQFVLDHRTDLGLTPEQVPFLESLARAQADSFKVRIQRRASAMQPSSRGAVSVMSWSGPIDEAAIREAAHRTLEDQDWRIRRGVVEGAQVIA